MKKPKLECLKCGEIFEARASKRSDTGRQKFCSFQCKVSYALIGKPKIKCENCKKDFSIYPSRLKFGKPRFCSLKCSNGFDYRRHMDAVERIISFCKTCNKSFEHRKTEPRKYCSTECANNRKREENPAKHRLGTSEWRKRRAEIIARDNGQCRKCGADSETLTVHHVIRWRKSKDDSPSNLITLCRSCHLKIEWHLMECPTP